MRTTEAFKLKNAAAGTYPVKPDGNGDAYLFGGEYQLQGLMTGSGTVDLKQLQAGGSTWVPIITQITSSPIAQQTVKLPPGRFEIVISGFTANFISLTRVPSSE